MTDTSPVTPNPITEAAAADRPRAIETAQALVIVRDIRALARCHGITAWSGLTGLGHPAHLLAGLAPQVTALATDFRVGVLPSSLRAGDAVVDRQSGERGLVGREVAPRRFQVQFGMALRVTWEARLERTGHRGSAAR